MAQLFFLFNTSVTNSPLFFHHYYPDREINISLSLAGVKGFFNYFHLGREVLVLKALADENNLGILLLWLGQRRRKSRNSGGYCGLSGLRGAGLARRRVK